MRARLGLTASVVGFISIVVLAPTYIWGCETSYRKETGSRPEATEHSGPEKANWDISREEFEAAKQRFRKQAEGLGRRVGNSSDDLWIWYEARLALASCNDLKQVTINVDVENEVITLSGTVSTESQKTAAEEIARAIEDVKSVKNDLVISASLGAG